MFLLSPLALALAAAVASRAQNTGSVVDLGYAKYRGATTTSGVVTYYGVPYAEPPIGSQRFRAPKPLDTARVTRELKGQVADATKYPQFCVQGSIGAGDAGGAGSEDCLNINIYTPAGTKAGSKLPVLFYIHGGGWFYGNPTNWPYELWVQQSPNVIVVSVYYRLNSFGFLTHPSLPDKDLNVGFQDQIEALRWVKKHITSFGGDPNKVTIDGHSAGGAAIELHLVTSSGIKEKLFRGAIAQSVSRAPLALPEQRKAQFDFYASAAGCKKGSFGEAFACLQSASVSALARAQDTVLYNFTSYRVFGPVLDGTLIKDYPTNLITSGEFSRVPIIVGATTDESSIPGALYNYNVTLGLMSSYPALKASSIPAIEALYPIDQFSSLEQRFTELSGDASFRCPRSIMGSARTAGGLSTYTYRYNQPISGSNGIVYHASENWLMFNGTSTGFNGTTVFQTQNAVEKAFSKEMIAYWLSFVRSGNPNTYKLAGSPSWPAYKLSNRKRVVLQANAPGGSVTKSNVTLETESAIEVQRCKEWEDVADEVQH